METKVEMILTVHEHLVEQGARQLMAALYTEGIVPPSFLRREAEVLAICREVEDAWFRGEIASPLYRSVLQEAQRRLWMRGCEGEQPEKTVKERRCSDSRESDRPQEVST